MKPFHSYFPDGGEQEGLRRRVFSVHDEQEMMMERKCMLQYLYARTHVHRTTGLPQGETFVVGVDVDSGRTMEETTFVAGVDVE